VSTTDHDIRTLNSLIATTLDSVDGYTEAAKDSDSGRFASLFTSRATERRQVVCRTFSNRFGRSAAIRRTSGTLLASAHRAFLNLKATLAGKDDEAIIAEVERGEDHIKNKFKDALGDTDLSAATRTVIEQAFTSVRAGHDQMSALKHSL
jgi:uncharacterized protein (TIGR02284 family)